MAYTTALAQWAGPQCSHTIARPGRPAPQIACRKGLFHLQHSICRLAQLKQRLPHATGTQVRDEDLASGGNQEAFQDMHEEKVLNAITDDNVVSRTIQREQEQRPRPALSVTPGGQKIPEPTLDEMEQLFRMYAPGMGGDFDESDSETEEEINEMIGDLANNVDAMVDELDDDLMEDDDFVDKEIEEFRQEDTAYLRSNLPQAAEFCLNFLWLEKNVAVSVDQIFGEDKKSPVTEYFFWPRVDAWEELKNAMEQKAWIDERDKIILLNEATQVINYWQDSEVKPSLDEVRQRFPTCMFQGSN